MRIVFMGTPDFAVASLAALQNAGHEIVGVVTAPDKPAGRGQKLQQPAVKQYALAHQIPVLQPQKLRDPEFLAALKDWKAELQVVVAFRMLPEVVWDMPPHGTVNLHASLLPQYRGAAPINHAIINGETESGVTTFLLQHEIDTGNILFSERMSIGPNETAGELHDRMMVIGAHLLVKTIRAIEEGTVVPQAQDALSQGMELRHAPKIFKTDCEIDWAQPVATVHNLVRGLSPYPTAYTILEGKTLKIFRAAPEPMGSDAPPGTYDSDGKTFFKCACSDGWLVLQEVQLEGKKRMDVSEFLRGFRLSARAAHDNGKNQASPR